jgi:molybdopterin-guanine dinucleotide biosynthesis protein A
MAKSLRDAAAVVLAGGESVRFGSDKALAQFRGEPLLAHVLRGLCGAGFAQVALAAKEPGKYAAVAEEIGSTSHRKIELLRDVRPVQTPLAGLEAGLRASRHQLVFACAADMPFGATPACAPPATCCNRRGRSVRAPSSRWCDRCGSTGRTSGRSSMPTRPTCCATWSDQASSLFSASASRANCGSVL